MRKFVQGENLLATLSLHKISYPNDRVNTLKENALRENSGYNWMSSNGGFKSCKGLVYHRSLSLVLLVLKP